MRPFLAVGLLAVLAAGAVFLLRPRSEAVYLFDCGGTIQRLEGVGATPGPGRSVADVDSTLPTRVRDGCAIHEGWFDADGDVLALRVQTESVMDERDELPAKLLTLDVSGLVPVAIESPGEWPPVRPPDPPDPVTVRARLRSVESPFARSVGYLLPDGAILLLQEMADDTSGPAPTVSPAPLWRPERVSLNDGREGATGRYALLDLETGARRGAVVSAAEGEVRDHRVVCFTPDGRIYLAAARNALLILDASDPSRRSFLSDLPLDLYWTGCAWR